MKHFVIVYVSAVQSHFWRKWKLVFNVLFVAPCTRANIFVTEKLSQKICSCGCGFTEELEKTAELQISIEKQHQEEKVAAC